MKNDDTIDHGDIDLLRRAGMSREDLEHSLLVARKALDIARRTGADLDLELVGRGALFHDLGKTKTHEIEHGRLGAELGASLGLPEAVCAIMEKHIRGGLTPAEATELGLPVKDYTLARLEERIVIYADRLVDIIHDGIVTIGEELEAEERFVEILEENQKYRKNELTMTRYHGYHQEIQGLVARRGQIPHKETIQTTMACAAYAEAGEPCPLSPRGNEPPASEAGEKLLIKTLEDDFACAAFHEQNESCPLCRDGKAKG